MKNLLENIALRQLRAKAQRQNSPLSFGDHFKDANRVLICMPVSAIEFKSMAHAITLFRHSFPKAHITLLHPQAIAVPANLTLGFEVVVWGPGDVDRVGRPAKALKSRLFAESFDVAIDLNVSAHLFCMAVTVESGAKVRVGFSHAERSELYNFLVRPEGENIERYPGILLAYLGKGDRPS